MKRVVLLCLASIIGTIAFAQQPTEWQPNIAEDNKAASLSDTTEFLLNAVRSNGGGGTVAYQNAAMSGSDTLELVLSDSTEARSHAHCCDGGEVILPIDDDKIGFAKIDPRPTATVGHFFALLRSRSWEDLPVTIKARMRFL